MGRRNKRLGYDRPRRDKRVRDMSPWFEPEGDCPSGKLRYETESKAAKALRSAQAKRAKHNMARVEKRYYACGFCDGYHLTSADDRNLADAWEVPGGQAELEGAQTPEAQVVRHPFQAQVSNPRPLARTQRLEPGQPAWQRGREAPGARGRTA